MKRTFGLFFSTLVCFAMTLLLPGTCLAQKAGLVECAPGGVVSLYSSMITLEIAATLKCGQVVTILGRYDNFFQVRTEKGENGFAAAESIRFLKTGTGASSSASRQKGKAGAASARGGNAAGAEVGGTVQARAITAGGGVGGQTARHLKIAQTGSSA